MYTDTTNIQTKQRQTANTTNTQTTNKTNNKQNKHTNTTNNKHTNKTKTQTTNTTNCVHKQTAPTGGVWGKRRVVQIRKWVEELLVGAGRTPHIPPGGVPVTMGMAGRGVHLQLEEGVGLTGGGGGERGS